MLELNKVISRKTKRQDYMRGWLRRYRGLVQFLLFLVVGLIYCLLLGSYALARQQRLPKPLNVTTNRPQPFAQVQKVQTQTSHHVAVTEMEAQDGDEEEIEAEGLDEVEAELEQRRLRVWQVCTAHNLQGKGQPNSWEFFIDSTHGLVWCNVFKAASSNWLYNFNLLGGYKDEFLRRSKKPLLALARSRFPRPSVAQLQQALPESLSFIIVREPFERLLSAYRNKIEGLPERFYRKLGREIVEKYRKRKPLANNTASGPTFPEFVDYVADRAPQFDEHWAPYHSFCTPCLVNFTVIAKLDSLTRDQEYIIRRAGLENILMLRQHSRQKPRIVFNKARDGKNTNLLLRKYYAQLSLDQLDKLYRIYGIDFEMFNYNFTKYTSIVKHDATTSVE